MARLAAFSLVGLSLGQDLFLAEKADLTLDTEANESATWLSGPAPPPPGPPYLGDAGSCYETSDHPYAVNWVAQGHDFFSGWSFQSGRSATRGVAWYSNWLTARHKGVIESHDNHAILRTGSRNGYYRDSIKIATKQRWTYFLGVMKFSHVPWGQGVWPAFWSNGRGIWPNGGEVDLLEYANWEENRISMHTGWWNQCKLDAAEVNRCGGFPDRNGMDYNCRTSYLGDHPQLGCAPTHDNGRKTPQTWANSPGVFAVESTEAFVKVFYIPEHEIPDDLNTDNPQPNSWDRWVVSYYPFRASEARNPGTCSSNPLSAQQLIINIELCGDWAGSTWDPRDPGAPQNSEMNRRRAAGECTVTGTSSRGDCCTQQMQHEDAESYLSDRAFFNISYVKVYTQTR